MSSIFSGFISWIGRDIVEPASDTLPSSGPADSGPGTDQSQHDRSSVFPIGWLPHSLILLGALATGTLLYQQISLWWHHSFQQAILDAQVVCPWIASYATSGQFTCGLPVPDAVNDTVVTDALSSIDIDVLANDTDPVGDALKIVTAYASSGTVTINDGGNLTYTPSLDFKGGHAITYEISNSKGGSDVANVTVYIGIDNEEAKSGSALQNDDPGSLVDPLVAMTPRDLVTMMVEAGVSAEDDYEDPKQILSLTKGGPGAWIATAIVDTHLNGHSLARVWIEGNVLNQRPKGEHSSATSCVDSETVPVGTLTGLVAVYQSLGRTPSNKQDSQDCFHPIRPDIRKRSELFAEELAGPHPSIWTPWRVPESSPAYLLVKRHMAYPWGHYDSDILAPLTYEEGAFGSLARSTSLRAYEYNRKTDQRDRYYTTMAGESSQKIEDLNWFNQDPSQLDAALFKVSNLLINEILRDKNVKVKRFGYQAWRGIIQWLLIVIACYLLLLMLWRLTATFTMFVAPRSFVFQPPLAVVGSIYDIPSQAFQSRRFVDQWINTLPLIGLFGTVLGILSGLPNAAAAITAKGPTASATVNALFEQLGLAFSTTALAVLGVIVFQLIWEGVQYFEDHTLGLIQRGKYRRYEKDRVVGLFADALSEVKEIMGKMMITLEQSKKKRQVQRSAQGQPPAISDS